jgi:hypothetical protein
MQTSPARVLLEVGGGGATEGLKMLRGTKEGANCQWPFFFSSRVSAK